MIKYLSIQNYTLIEHLELNFTEGTTIITGETGAGKSILIGALGLVLGQRADTQALMDKLKKCIIEVHIDISPYQLNNFFDIHELDYEPCTIIRREVLPNNRSRAFINDTPVNVNILRELASFLIDIHSQHDTLSLNQSDYQMAVLDDFSGNQKTLDQYKTIFQSYNTHKQEIAKLKDAERKQKADYDYYRYLAVEINDAQIKDSEQEELENELNILINSEDIKRKIHEILGLLNNNDVNIISGLKEITAKLNMLINYLPETEDLHHRTHTTFIELKDIYNSLSKTEADIVYSAERIEEINGRLNIIYGLEQKHRVNTVKELNELSVEYEQKVKQIDTLEVSIQNLEKIISEEEKELLKLAGSLSENRQKNIGSLKQKIVTLLQELAMANAEFEISMNSRLPLNNTGSDHVRFLFSANKGAEVNDISKVASGGELSRLMLAIKSVVSQQKLLPSIIFDEIDTGISGETAVKTAHIINNMAKHMQIIAITHLPQIACLGNNHFLVYKDIKDSKSTTFVKKLDDKSRVSVIAEIISGKKITDAALATAQELLNKFKI